MSNNIRSEVVDDQLFVYYKEALIYKRWLKGDMSMVFESVGCPTSSHDRDKIEEHQKYNIISAFPGTGKSHFSVNSSLKVLDSDSSTFDKSQFPENYINHIKSNEGKADIICISSHEEVRRALVENNLQFALVYPNPSLKEEYLDRYKQRGSSEDFIRLLETNWDLWLKGCSTQDGCCHIVLESGEFLNDIYD